MKTKTPNEVVTGFNLKTDLLPIPNRVKYSKPKLVNGILVSTTIK